MGSLDYVNIVQQSRPVHLAWLGGSTVRDFGAVGVTWAISTGTPSPAQAGSFVGGRATLFSAASYISSGAVQVTDIWTHEAWVRRVGTVGVQAIIGRASPTGGHSYLRFDGSNIEILNSGTAVLMTAAGVLSDTIRWHHIVGVKNAGTSAAIYLDGKSVGGSFSNSTCPDGGQYLISRDKGENGNHLIQFAATYNRALSAGEVLRHYLAGRFLFQS